MSRRYVSRTESEFVESCIFASILLNECAEWGCLNAELEAELQWAANLDCTDFSRENARRVDLAISEGEAVRDALEECVWSIEHIPEDSNIVIFDDTAGKFYVKYPHHIM